MRPILLNRHLRPINVYLLLATFMIAGMGLNPLKAQVLFTYTNLTSGNGTVAPNIAPASLSRGVPNILQASDCMGDQGYGSHGWPTTNVFDVNNFNANGWFVEFTLDPDPGFGLKVTGFSARSRRENQTGTADDGPIAIRYGYSVDGGSSWTTVNPGNPLSSNICTSSGVNRTWPLWNVLNTSNPIIFRIYGLSSGSNLTGDMFLRDIVVNGEVCANAPDITLGMAPSYCFSNNAISANIPYVSSDGDEYSINIPGLGVNTPYAALPASPITYTIPAGSPAGTYNGTVTVRNECGFEDPTPAAFSVTIHALPTPSITVSEDSGINADDAVICAGDLVTLTAAGGVNYLWSNSYTSNPIDVYPISNTTYSVVVYSMEGCSAVASQQITVDPVTATVDAGEDRTTCVDGIILTAGVIGGTATSSTWSASVPGGAFDDETALQTYYTPPSGYIYPILLILTTDGVCPARDTMMVTYGNLPPLELVVQSPADATCGDEITLQIVASSGFTDLTSLQFSVNWDETQLEYVNATGTDVNGEAPGLEFYISDPDQLRYTWFDQLPPFGETVADGTVLVNLTLKAINNAGLTQISITDIPVIIEATNNQFCVLTVNTTSDDIELNPIEVVCPNNFSVCLNTPANALPDGTPAGGDYSGPGVSGNMFDPSVAGLGNHILTYTYTDGNNCTNACTLQVTVNQIPDASLVIAPTNICPGASVTLTFNEGNFMPGTFFNVTASVTPQVNGSGVLQVNGLVNGDFASFTEGVNFTGDLSIYQIVVTETVTGCTNSASAVMLDVYDAPLFGFSASTTSDPGETGDNDPVTQPTSTVTVDFCTGDLLTLGGYSDNGNIGYIVSYTSTGNVTYGGGGSLPTMYGPDYTSATPANAATFFNSVYGGYALSSGTYGEIVQTFTPYLDVNNNNSYDLGVDCDGSPMTLVYRVYAPIALTVTRNTGGSICSGDVVQYTFSTTSTEDVTFDLVYEENANAGNPADLDDDNVFPAPTSHTISAGNDYVFTATLNNAVGTFDRGRVRVRAINIGYADADVCTTADVNGQNTQVYPEPRLEPVSDILLSCDGNTFELDVNLLGLPSMNAAQAGNPIRIDWTVSGTGIVENGASGNAVIYDGSGLDIADLQQVLSLVDPQLGAQTATLIITPRASGPTNAFNGDDCYGDPIYVDVEVVPAGVPEISGPSCTYIGASILLTGTDNIQLPATVVDAAWSTDGSGYATVDAFGNVTGVSVGTTTVYYTVTDNAGCITTASFNVTVLDEVVLTSVYTGGSVACGEEFTISVQVSNFCDIGTLDYYFSWDPAEFQYVTGTTPPVPDGIGVISTLNVGNGELVYTFGSTSNSGGTSLSDGTVVFTYTLRAIGGAGIYNVPETIIELNAYNSNFSPVGTSSTGVSIEVTAITIALGPNPVICPSDDFIHLTYTSVGGNPNEFVIDFDALAEAAGFPDTWQGQFDPNDGEILIPVPANVDHGSYNGTLVLSNSLYGCESLPYLITIIVDQTPPTASTPAPLNLECLFDIPAPNPAVVIDEADNCPTPPVVVYEPNLSTETGTGCAGSPKIINRVYSVTDEAGNTTYVTHTITVEDDVPPTISTSGLAPWYPSGLAAVNAAIARANATKIDGNGCTAPVGITVSYNAMASDTSGCNGVIVLVVQDACGNITPAINATYFVTIDRTPPVATAGTIDECYDADETPDGPYEEYDYAVQAALAATTATDDCDNNLTFTAVTTGTDCNLTITVTVTDDCGRTATAVYHTRVDSDGPTFFPLNANQIGLLMDGDCFDTEQEALDAAVVIVKEYAGDDCGSPDDLQFDAFANGGCPAEIMVVVTDFCGNPSTVTFTGVHIDTVDPQVDPDQIYADCFKTLQEAYDSLSKAAHPYDNCTTEAELLASYTVSDLVETPPLNDGCTQYYIEFTFTDNCGNSVSYPYEYITIDNTAPTAQPMSTLSYTCLDDVDAPNTGDVVASDNCGVQDIIWVADVLPTSCPGTGTRTYRVFDCAGNSLDVVQTISVNDNVTPTWVTPAGDLNRQPNCDDQSSIDDALSLEPEAEDNCGEVTVVLESSTPTNTCAGGFIRTWRAYDECGNSSTTIFTQTINIVDNDAPTWVTTPYDINTEVECSDEDGLEAALDQQPIAEDNCSGVTYTMADRTYTEYVECVNFYKGEWVTEWVAVDACGNKSVSFFHYVYVYDNTAPTWNTPADSLNGTISCSDIVGYDYLNNLYPVASDNCVGNLVYDKTTGSFVPGGDCPGEGSFTNTWVVYDACGNQSTSYTQVITVVDNTPPSFDPGCQFMPLNLYTSPDGGPAADCHDGISLQVGDILNYQSGWTVAGVSIDPLGACIGDDCSPISSITAEVVSIQEVVIDDFVDGNDVYDCVRQITVSFQLTDACGNVQPTLFVCVYNIIDNTVPDVYCPDGGGPSLPLGCYPSVAAAEAAAREAIDPCDNCTDVEDLQISVSTIGTCNAEVTVTVADCAGNEDSYTFFTRIDGDAPVLTASNIQLCYNTVAEAQAAAIAGTTITDNCNTYGELNITTTVNGTCPASVTVTAMDQCGNSRSVVYNGLCIGMSSQVEITDEADNLNVDCVDWQTDLNSWLANHGGGVAPGNDIQWSYLPLDPATMLQNSMPNCTTHTKSVVVTFRATNGCGNFDETTATFSVTDNVPPTANLIANTNLTCSTAIPAPNLELVTGEADNCGGSVTVSLFGTSDNMAAGCANSPRIVIHQYLVTDAYCNTALINHTITVVDNVAPTFTAPANITVNVNAGCSYNASTVVTGDVTDESDNCTPSGPGLQAYYTESINPGNAFQVKYVITRTWYLTDACGNAAIPKVQTITVLDVIAPTIVGCPANMTLPGTTIENACGAYFGAQTNPAFSDNCSGATIAYQLSGATLGSGLGYLSPTDVFNEGTTTVTYTVTDAVGNTASCSFTVSVNCLTISGRIIWEHDGVSGVKDATTNVTNVLPTPAFSGSDLSDTNGNYDVSVPVDGIYKVRPVKNINRLNGVTSADATAINNHVNLSNPITNPYKKVCADVNRSGVIQTQDATLITQCLAGNPTALAIFNVFWRFVPTDYVMPGTPHQNVPAFPDFKDVTLAGMDAANINFYGMKIGDVAAPWANPQNAPIAPLVWMVQDQQLVKGADMELTFTVSNFTDLSSYQFALDFDPTILKFEGFEPLTALPLNLLDNFGAYSADMGELRHVWATGGGVDLAEGTAVFRAKFKVLEGGQKLSEVLSLDDSQIECKAFNRELVPAELRLVFTETTAVDVPTDLHNLSLELFQNRPNPFVDATTIGFILPEACEAHIRILDISGRELTSYDRKYTAGYHELDFRMENASFYGVLFCELTTPQGKRTIKMLTAK